jgi:hypothetical protein
LPIGVNVQDRPEGRLELGVDEDVLAVPNRLGGDRGTELGRAGRLDDRVDALRGAEYRRVVGDGRPTRPDGGLESANRVDLDWLRCACLDPGRSRSFEVTVRDRRQRLTGAQR